METEIKAALMALLTAIKNSNAGVIAKEMAKLDDFAARGRASLHPQLLHFLERRSYAKAAMYLDGAGDIPAGLCGGGAAKVPRARVNETPSETSQRGEEGTVK